MWMWAKQVIIYLLVLSMVACNSQAMFNTKDDSVDQASVGPATSSKIEASTVDEQPVSKGRKLDVIIPVFDSGLDDEVIGETVWAELRRAEATIFANQLKATLDATGQFAAVRVTPDANATGELYIQGRIEQSTGHDVEISLSVSSIAGEDVIARSGAGSFSFSQLINRDGRSIKSFEHTVDKNYFMDPRNNKQEAYQPVFDEASDFVVSLLKKYSEAEKTELSNLSDLRFAASFSEDAFSEYMVTKKGETHLVGMPSMDDPMYQKVRALRVRDQLFIDNLQNEYQGFNQQINESYLLWQEQSLEEHVLQKEAKARSTKKILGGIALIGLAILSASSNSGQNTVGDNTAATAAVTAGVAAVGLISSGIHDRKEAAMHNETIKELGQSVDIEMSPQVVAFEEREKELVGDSAEQFQQWRSFLKTIYELERTPDVQL